jgi:phage terminase small subunit
MFTEKKKQFADNYLTCFNATESAIKAGYKNKDISKKANKLLNDDPDIALYIKEKLKEKEEKDIAKRSEILKFLTNCLRGNETEPIPFVVRSGTTGKDGYYDDKIVIEDIPIKIKDRLKAAELLAKIHHLMDKNEETSTEKVIINYNIPKNNGVLDD